MRSLPLVLALVVAVGCGGGAGSGAAASGRTDLRITAWPNGRGTEPVKRWKLRCDPARGTFPNRARACRRLAETPSPLAPVPKDRPCAQIYGGPAEALVTGPVGGRRVRATFHRRDGCEIARWNRFLPVFPHIEIRP